MELITTDLYVMGIASFINLLYVVSQTRREHVLSLLYFALNMVYLLFQLQFLEYLTLHILVFLRNLGSDKALETASGRNAR